MSDAFRGRLVAATAEPAPAPTEAAPPLQLSDRIAMGRALWRDLVIGFAAQLGELGLGFSQLAALYATADTATLTVADLAEQIGRSPSATSRIVGGLERRGLVRREEEVADRRQRIVRLTPEGHSLLGVVDLARAEQFLAVVRSLPQSDRMLVAMGVSALAERVVDRRGRLIKARPSPS
ncbi:MAG TPA: MarR family transcriptional regulator [Candidatus Limnocylindrales bacterium]|nr:MarR family transcriptional regulator [Candidatus Limnocylindrales bacterium]